jgi:hypothetical protein
MIFIQHSNLNGLHAPFSASQSSWLRYDDEKLINSFNNKKAAEMGTRLHAWAKETIDLGIKQPRSKKTIYAYVNDAIGFKMDTEVVLYYSDYFFGTADTISFRKGPNGRNILRIHDLKTGFTPVKMEQPMIYAALFCLEYKVRPCDIDIELRIYQNDECLIHNPSPDEIQEIMDIIVRHNKILEENDYNRGV